MKVTAINQQLKRQDRYSIYVDAKYSFSLSEAELIRLGLREGQELTKAELESLRNEAEMDKAYDRSLRYLSIRPRSQYEIETYLQRKGYNEELIATLLQRLLKMDMLNDQAFAEQWLQWRLSSGRSKRHIQAELIQKRVDKEIINEVLGGVDADIEIEQLKMIIERKGKLAQYQDKQKLIAYLARKGFNYDVIKKALNND